MRRAGLEAAACALGLVASCAGPQPARWTRPDDASWRVLRAELDRERARFPRGPWSATMHIAMREPRSGRVVDGRGAIAVAPGRAVRLILVGPAGVTMLDAWVTRRQWRIALPTAGRVQRGGAEDPAGMPVGFLRWWFFTPLGGELSAAARTPDGAVWVLRDGDATIELRRGVCAVGGEAAANGGAKGGDPGEAGEPDEPERLAAARRSPGHREQVDQCRREASPRAGDWVRYLDEVSRLTVDLTLESVASAPPGEEAFQDPDGAAEAGKDR